MLVFADDTDHKTPSEELISELASPPARLHQPAAAMGALADRFNLEKQLVFYLSYHDNATNQWIHFMCIWPILISALTMFADTEPLAKTPEMLSSLPYGDYMVLNYSAVIAAVYMAWYILLDPLYVSLDL